ncbi:hypothetical protein HIM_01643 [Hirsutella minnesotensis 3608]|nr:hypothetical protein HIM_01643 [Hirsutella minnesotensis 3608]
MPSPSPLNPESQQFSNPADYTPTPKQKPRNRGHTASRTSRLPTRARSAKQPLHIRMNLTETQMDRITEAFTNKVDSSPVRARPRVEPTPTKSNSQGKQEPGSRSKATYSLSSSGDEGSGVASTTFSDLMPQNQADLFSTSLAERRQQHRPSPLQVGEGRTPARTPRRMPMESLAQVVSPLTPVKGNYAEGSGSSYAPSSCSNTQIEWLLQKGAQSQAVEGNVDGPVVNMYNTWSRVESSPERTTSSVRQKSLEHQPRRSKSTSDGLRQPDLVPSTPAPPLPSKAAARRQENQESPLFSPLALYFRGQDCPSTKRGEKTLIGQNGWLERTGVAADQEKKAPQKKTGILESIKRIAKDMTAEFQNSNRRSQQPTKEQSASHVRISLDPREQSLMYCELEYHLTSALNDFMTAELDKGHLVPDNLKKVSDAWANQGRPKVVGFRFDLETQLQLVALHVNDFNFYGRRQGSHIEITGLLDAMKTNARQMRVRTFCQPDSVIAKQLVDSQSLFNMINAADVPQIAMAEIAQFFRVIVEREREKRERRSREVRKTHIPRVGQQSLDINWQPREPAGDMLQQCDQEDNEGGAAYSTKARDRSIVQDPLPYAR